VPGDHAAAHYRLPRARRRDEDPEFVRGDGVYRGLLFCPQRAGELDLQLGRCAAEIGDR
jgi:hypothetical protein